MAVQALPVDSPIVVDGSAVTQPISAATLPLPAGAATNAAVVALTKPSDTQLVDGSAHTQPVSGTFFQATQPVSGTVAVSNFPATQPVSIATMPSTPVTGTFFQATQPVSLATAPTTPVTGTFWQATQPVSISTMPSTPVTGTFFQATQPVSLTSTTITGTAAVTQSTSPWVVSLASTTITGTVAVTESGTWTVQPGNTPNTAPWLTTDTFFKPAILSVTATAATGVAVTATLPSVTSQFHYISLIEITKYFTAANAASATPLVVTTTNIPALAFTFGQPLGTIGTSDTRIYSPCVPLRSTAVTTATTIVCPATTGIIWRINVWYYAAV